jgi:hypothetical protein
MPGSGSVGQVVLDDKPHRQGDHTVRVMAFRQSEIVHVGVEVDVAPGTAMLRVRDEQIAGSAADSVSQIVQRPNDNPKPIGSVAAQRTRLTLVVAAALDDLRLWEVFNTGDAFGRIREVLSRFGHGGNLQKQSCFRYYRYPQTKSQA